MNELITTYKLLSLTHMALTASQPSYLYNLQSLFSLVPVLALTLLSLLLALQKWLFENHH